MNLSTKNDLPVYRVSGGAGFIWAASWDSDGRGNLRMLAINSSELPTPANLNPPDQVEANLSASNPLASFAQKSLDESVGIGFFVSAEGHIHRRWSSGYRLSAYYFFPWRTHHKDSI